MAEGAGTRIVSKQVNVVPVQVEAQDPAHGDAQRAVPWHLHLHGPSPLHALGRGDAHAVERPSGGQHGIEAGRVDAAPRREPAPVA